MTLRQPHESPQIRRLRHDLVALEQLQDESNILRFRPSGSPPQRYLLRFYGRSLAREQGRILVRESHEVEIKLGSSYPRTGPELRWLTPIYHPNISEIGLVCLGAYGTHWVPSLHLDELCVMLWDMARYHNYDIRSPYNRDAALWAANQSTFTFPTDSRPLRDKRVAQGRIVPPETIIEPEPIPLDDNPWVVNESQGTGLMPVVGRRETVGPANESRPPSPTAFPPGQDVIFLD